MTTERRYAVAYDPFHDITTWVPTRRAFVWWFFREWLEAKVFLAVMAWQAHVCSLFGHDYWMGAICRRCTHVSETFRQQLLEQRHERPFRMWPHYYGPQVLERPRFIVNNVS